MRMRKKKHGAERLAACDEYIIKSANDVWNEPFYLEIGCGKGSFISALSSVCPKNKYIAMEKISDVALLAAEKIKAGGQKNVRFLIGDAKNLPEYVPDGSVLGIYINFCDPWSKKGYAKRRLTHRGFLEMYKKLLAPGGGVFFKTDNSDLFEFSIGEFTDCGFSLCNVTRDLHGDGSDGNIVTEYETNFSEKGFKINRLEAYYKQK